MTPLVKVIVAVVAILILVLIAVGFYAMQGGFKKEHADVPPSGAAAPTLVSLESAAPGGQGRTMPEMAALTENQRYFSTCSYPNDNYECAIKCGDSINMTASAEYGPGMEYKDWVQSQALDPQIARTHADYLADRKRNPFTSNVTGPTWTPDYHMSYDPIPWIGLRRPQNVPVCNPTQVPDVDYSLYEDCSKFTWRSS